MCDKERHSKKESVLSGHPTCSQSECLDQVAGNMKIAMMKPSCLQADVDQLCGPAIMIANSVRRQDTPVLEML
jgi:hypothetical protein